VIPGRAYLPSLAFLLAACSGMDPRCAVMPGAGTYCLQPTTAVAPFDTRQKVALSFRGWRETMIVQLEVDSEKMRFAGLTPFGHTLIEAAYDNRAVSAEKTPGEGFEPMWLFAALQIALWPLDAVRAGFDDAVDVDEDGGTRRVFSGGDEFITIRYVGFAPAFSEIGIDYPSLCATLEIKTLGDDHR
jgi:hypothetical protein